MKVRTFGMVLLAVLLAVPSLSMNVLAYPGDPGPNGEWDLDYNYMVDLMDEDLLWMFIAGVVQPTEDQFFRADTYPCTYFGVGNNIICPQGDGVLNSADEIPLDEIMSGDWFPSSLPQCPYDFDKDGHIDNRSPGGDDCDDTNPNVHPGATEECGGATCADGIDNDCDGLIDSADADCTQWCPSAAQASTLAGLDTSRSNPVNLLAFLLVPVAAVLIWKGFRRAK